ncbi:MAG: mechanosensitive ion channel [Verrucomicrobia bacterium]|nr:mechanosensitive ion channel [Verrucomicrobiota bacterium]
MNRVPKSVFVLLAFAAMVGGMPAQQVSATATPRPTATPAPTPAPIALPDIVTEAASTQSTLQGLNTELESDPVKAAVIQKLPNLEREIDTRGSESARIIRNGPSLDILGELLTGWQSLRDTANRWSHDLIQRATDLDAELARLDAMAQTWNLTENEARSKNAPPDVLDHVTRTVGLITQTQNAITNDRTDILSLQSRLAVEGARVQAVLDQVQQAKQRALSQLLDRESPPIWELRENGALGHSTRNPFLNQLRRLENYVAEQPARFIAHIALILCLFIALRWARKGIRQWVQEDPSLERAVPVFNMPIAAAISLSMLFLRLIYPEMPRLLMAFFGIVGLISVALLLRQLLEKRTFPILYALIILFFIDEIRLVIVGVPLITRCLFVAQLVGSIGFIVWLLRSSRRAATGTGQPLPRAGKWFARLSLVLLAIALVGNILGYATLSYLLGNSVLRAAYLALVFYAAIRILEGLVIISFQVRPLAYFAAVRKHRGLLRQRVMQVLRAITFLLWLNIVLKQFQLTDPLFNGAKLVLGVALTLGSFRLSLGQIASFILVVWASFLVSKFLRFLLEEDVYDRLKLSRGLPYAISSVLHYTVLLIGFFVALAALGVDMTKFTILAGAFSVGIGFGLQNVINNFVSGLILLFERPIKVGDVIQVGDAVGSVRKIGIRASLIRTPNGSEIIVPNGTLISSEVTNWTFSDRQRAITAQIQVPRGVDQKTVVQLLKDTATETPGVAKTPVPQAYVTTLSSNALTLELRAWTDRYEDWMEIQSDLWIAINRKLEQKQIALA